MWPNPQETGDLVTFTEEIVNGKLHFLCSDSYFHEKSTTYKRNNFLYNIVISVLKKK